MAINHAGEGFLRDLRVRVFDRLQAQSLAFFDRNKAGVLVSRMTADIESMGELIQWGLLQFVSAGAAARDHADRAAVVISWQLTLVVLLVLPIIVVAVGAVPARVERRLPRRCARSVGQNLSTPAGGHRRRARDPGLRPRATSRRAGSANEPALFDSHMHSRAGQHVVLRRWSSSSACSRSAIVVGVGGWLAHRGTITRRHGRRRSCCCSATCSSPCSSCRSCTTRSSPRRRRCTSCTA